MGGRLSVEKDQIEPLMMLVISLKAEAEFLCACIPTVESTPQREALMGAAQYLATEIRQIASLLEKADA